MRAMLWPGLAFLGTAVAWYYGAFNLGYALLVLVGAVLLLTYGNYLGNQTAKA